MLLALGVVMGFTISFYYKFTHVRAYYDPTQSPEPPGR